MSVLFTYLLFIGAGIAVGGAYSMFKVNKLASGILLALAVLAAAAALVCHCRTEDTSRHWCCF